MMYTTNAVESVNTRFRKVTKKGAFPNENALLKFLYLCVRELQDKWDGGHTRDWSLVLNQLMHNENSPNAFRNTVSICLNHLLEMEKRRYPQKD